MRATQRGFAPVLLAVVLATVLVANAGEIPASKSAKSSRTAQEFLGLVDTHLYGNTEARHDALQAAYDSGESANDQDVANIISALNDNVGTANYSRSLMTLAYVVGASARHGDNLHLMNVVAQAMRGYLNEISRHGLDKDREMVRRLRLLLSEFLSNPAVTIQSTERTQARNLLLSLSLEGNWGPQNRSFVVQGVTTRPIAFGELLEIYQSSEGDKLYEAAVAIAGVPVWAREGRYLPDTLNLVLMLAVEFAEIETAFKAAEYLCTNLLLDDAFEAMTARIITALYVDAYEVGPREFRLFLEYFPARTGDLLALLVQQAPRSGLTHSTLQALASGLAEGMTTEVIEPLVKSLSHPDAAVSSRASALLRGAASYLTDQNLDGVMDQLLPRCAYVPQMPQGTNLDNEPPACLGAMLVASGCVLRFRDGQTIISEHALNTAFLLISFIQDNRDVFPATSLAVLEVLPELVLADVLLNGSPETLMSTFSSDQVQSFLDYSVLYHRAAESLQGLFPFIKEQLQKTTTWSWADLKYSDLTLGILTLDAPIYLLEDMRRASIAAGRVQSRINALPSPARLALLRKVRARCLEWWTGAAEAASRALVILHCEVKGEVLSAYSAEALEQLRTRELPDESRAAAEGLLNSVARCKEVF